MSDKEGYCGYAIKESGIALLNPKEEILLQLRDNRPGLHQAGQWALIGGHIEPGETPYDAMRRELCEELEVSNIPFRKLLVVPAGDVEYHLYAGRIEISESELVVNEGQRVAFFALNDALNLELLTDTAKLMVDTLIGIDSLRRMRGQYGIAATLMQLQVPRKDA